MRQVLIKALKTFVQTTVGYICALNLMQINWSDGSVATGVLVSAVAAGLSAVMNIDWNVVEGGEKKDE